MIPSLSSGDVIELRSIELAYLVLEVREEYTDGVVGGPRWAFDGLRLDDGAVFRWLSIGSLSPWVKL